MDGAPGETQIIDYTRRGHRGNVAGRGFEPRRLHSRRTHNPAQIKTGSSVDSGEPFFLANYTRVLLAFANRRELQTRLFDPCSARFGGMEWAPALAQCVFGK